jgi:voltage-gated potassium channel Kch
MCGARMARAPVVERIMARFMHQEVTVRTAARVIVVFTLIVVVLGGVLMRVVDSEEYPNIWKGMWWALQTVTTVGYGDVTPQETSGRIVAALVMLEGVAFLTVVIAAITSIFIACEQAKRRAAREALGEDEGDDMRTMHARFDDLEARLDRLEEMLSRRLGPGDGSARSP